VNTTKHLTKAGKGRNRDLANTPIVDVAADIWNDLRNPACTRCPLFKTASRVCMMGVGDYNIPAMVVQSEPTDEDDLAGSPGHGSSFKFLNAVFNDLNINILDLYLTSAVKCRPPSFSNRKKLIEQAQRECGSYLDDEIVRLKPKAILSLGAAAYWHFSHKAGLTGNRGLTIEYTAVASNGEEWKTKVIPTLAPYAIIMNPSKSTSFYADIAKWWKVVEEEAYGVVDTSRKVEVVEVRSLNGLVSAMLELAENPNTMLTYDVETRGFFSHKFDYARLWCVAATNGTRTENGLRVFLIPVEHPDSSWFGNPAQMRVAIGLVVELVSTWVKTNGHNVKFDWRWVHALAKRHGIETGRTTIGYDTMVAAHLLDEQRPMNLLDQASTELQIEDWGKGNQQFGLLEGDDMYALLARNNRTKAGTIPRGKSYLGDLWGPDGLGTYCAIDVGYTHMLYEKQREHFRTEQGLARLLRHLILPGLEAFERVEDNGIHVFMDKLEKTRQDFIDRAAYIRKELKASYVDKALLKEAVVKVEREYKVKTVWVKNEETGVKERVKVRTYLGTTGKSIFDNPTFLRAWLFGATTEGGLGMIPYQFTEKTGEPKVDDDALESMDHPAAKLLQELRSAKKALDFFNSWEEWLGTDGRLHPYFNLTGTVTGRRSCNNPNLMQVPRKKEIRTCLGAKPGHIFLEVDFSQIEVRLAAWAAGETNMINLFNEGGDIYAYVGAQLAGYENVTIKITKGEVDPEDRRKAKAVVLGYLYGMSAKGFKEYARSQYDVIFTDTESEAHRNTFFRLFPNLLRYHHRQQQLASRDLKVTSLTGRIRHLLDILSEGKYERGRSERQAINSPIQGLGGDWILASIVSLMPLLDPEEALIIGDIHDAVLFELRYDTWQKNAELIMEIMEAPPIMREQFGIVPPLALTAEGKVGLAWGEGFEFNLSGDGGIPTIEAAVDYVDALMAA